MLLELGLRVYEVRWSVKSLHLIRLSLINYFLMCCKNTVISSENFGY